METGLGNIAFIIIFALPLAGAYSLGWIHKKIKKNDFINYKLTGITFWSLFVLEVFYVVSD